MNFNSDTRNPNQRDSITNLLKKFEEWFSSNYCVIKRSRVPGGSPGQNQIKRLYQLIKQPLSRLRQECFSKLTERMFSGKVLRKDEMLFISAIETFDFFLIKHVFQ